MKAVIRLSFVLLVVLGSFVLSSATDSIYTEQEKAFYADPNTVAFVRPGLVIRVLSAEIAQDGTIRARVKFTDPRGLPLDRLGINTPGAVSNGNPGMIAAYIPKGKTQWVAYTTRTQTSPITKVSAIQAGADSGGTWTQVAEGEYTYTFARKAPQDFDRTATHSIGVYGNRNLTEFELGTNLADTVFTFVPDGSAPAKRELISNTTCNKCHDSLAAHGSTGRVSLEMCNLCHTPQTIDPDTGNTVDMPVMTHKIHAGEDLPSVQAGKPYVIIGNAQSAHDYSHVKLPSNIRSCETCHEQGKGMEREKAYLTSPSRAVCGSCHDTVNFATGEGHLNLPQVSDNQCASCHIPQGELEFDASIKGAHTIATQSSMLSGVQYELIKVDNGKAGEKPTVTFSLKDKNGNPVDIARMQRLGLVLAGPSTDYNGFPNGYVAEDAIKATGSGGTYTYTFNTAIPADAKGSFSVGIEGRLDEKLLEGTRKEMTVRYGPPNKVMHFSVDGSPVQPRRTVVSMAKCNACHTNLTLHGENRNQIEQCVLCHNPVETDALRRPANDMPAQTIDMRWMIHRIHGGQQTSTAYGTKYEVYGYGNTKHDFSHVGYPAPLTSCDMCHVNDSQSLPLARTNAKLNNPRGLLNPMEATTAACTSCHQSVDAASHALVNTSALGESCGACHGRDSQFSVNKVHAR